MQSTHRPVTVTIGMKAQRSLTRVCGRAQQPASQGCDCPAMSMLLRNLRQVSPTSDRLSCDLTALECAGSSQDETSRADCDCITRYCRASRALLTHWSTAEVSTEQ
jgi:hypothetical protein